MKNTVLITLAIILFTACNNKEERYTQTSAEIDVFKNVIENYDQKKWDDLLSHFSDTTKVFFNSDTPIEIANIPAYHQNTDINLTKRGFEDEGQEFEMVVDDKGRTWVNFWGNWKGTLAGTEKEIEIPIHLTAQFINGKIVREYGYWDNAPITKAIQDIEAQNHMPADEKNITTTINNIVKAWNTNDKGLMYECMVNNCIRKDNGIVFSENQNGYGKFMDIYHKGFPDFTVSIDNISIKDNKAYIYWTVTGTNTGNFLDQEPTNKKIKSHGFSIWRFDKNGKALQENAFYDNLVVYQQLGMSLPKK